MTGHYQQKWSLRAHRLFILIEDTGKSKLVRWIPIFVEPDHMRDAAVVILDSLSFGKTELTWDQDSPECGKLVEYIHEAMGGLDQLLTTTPVEPEPYRTRVTRIARRIKERMKNHPRLRTAESIQDLLDSLYQSFIRRTLRKKSVSWGKCLYNHLLSHPDSILEVIRKLDQKSADRGPRRAKRGIRTG